MTNITTEDKLSGKFTVLSGNYFTLNRSVLEIATLNFGDIMEDGTNRVLVYTTVCRRNM